MNEVPITTTFFPFACSTMALASEVLKKNTPSKSLPGTERGRGLKKKLVLDQDFRQDSLHNA